MERNFSCCLLKENSICTAEICGALKDLNHLHTTSYRRLWSQFNPKYEIINVNKLLLHTLIPLNIVKETCFSAYNEMSFGLHVALYRLQYFFTHQCHWYVDRKTVHCTHQNMSLTMFNKTNGQKSSFPMQIIYFGFESKSFL